MSKLVAATLAMITLTAGAGLAQADDKAALLSQIGPFVSAPKYFDQGGIGEAGRFTPEPAECLALVDKLEAAGMRPEEVVPNYPDDWTFKTAREKCERYARYRVMVGAIPAIRGALSSEMAMRGLAPGDEGATRFGGLAATAGDACVTAINQLEAKKAPMDHAMKFPEAELTLTAARTRCEEIAARGKTLQGASAAADADKAKAARERYTRHGAAGDKLEWLLYYDPDGRGTSWYLAPKCAESSDPRTLVKAKVLIRWGINPDGTHVLRKLTFKGNKKVKDQEKTFLTEAKAYSFCK